MTPVIFYAANFISSANLREGSSLSLSERNALLGIAAHELRSPLTTIMGYTELLTEFDNIEEAKQKEMLRIINERSEHLLNIINKLQNITRIDKSTVSINKQEKDIVFFLRKKVHEANLKARKKNIRINFESAEKYFELSYDPDRMEEVVSILLDNAVKFSPQNSEVLLSFNAKDNEALITVEDRG